MLYAFENYLLDEERRELHRGSAVVPIEPGVFDLLLCLIRNRDRVVSKDDLLAAVWNGRIVSESTLSSRINAARCALGDSGEQQRLIRTFPRKGFRFVGEIRAAQRPVNDRPQSSVVPVPLGPAAVRLNEPERRQLTIMACEIVGLATLSARLDPEDLREVVAAYHGCIREVVEQQKGICRQVPARGGARLLWVSASE